MLPTRSALGAMRLRAARPSQIARGAKPPSLREGPMTRFGEGFLWTGVLGET
jgi:hypothetical protein